MEARFGVQDGQFALKMESVESRLVIKLGILITVLFGVTGTIVALLR
jgi:hypothetical protein